MALYLSECVLCQAPMETAKPARTCSNRCRSALRRSRERERELALADRVRAGLRGDAPSLAEALAALAAGVPRR